MNNDFEPATQQRFLDAVDAFRHWFLTQAMPLWARQGVDHERGGFFEKLDTNGRPLDEPRRTRVVARQIYVFCVAIKLGWQGDAQPLVLHGLDFLLNRLRAPDHTFHSAITPEGAVVNPKFDLYERANRVNAHPWLADLLIWRAKKSPRLLQRMSGVLNETSNPGNLVSLKGISRLFFE